MSSQANCADCKNLVFIVVNCSVYLIAPVAENTAGWSRQNSIFVNDASNRGSVPRGDSFFIKVNAACACLAPFLTLTHPHMTDLLVRAESSSRFFGFVHRSSFLAE